MFYDSTWNGNLPVTKKNTKLEHKFNAVDRKVRKCQNKLG